MLILLLCAYILTSGGSLLQFAFDGIDLIFFHGMTVGEAVERRYVLLLFTIDQHFVGLFFQDGDLTPTVTRTTYCASILTEKTTNVYTALAHYVRTSFLNYV